MKVHVDFDACTGHGRCYALAPDLFDSDDEGHSRPRMEDVPAGLEQQARNAVGNCPEGAISITE